MKYYISLKDTIPEQGSGHVSFDLLTEENGCKNGCICGVSRYTEKEYREPGCHEDQEGFYVISGSGMAKVGEQEFCVSAGMAFIAPAGVPHTIRTADENVPVEVFWFHAAV